MIATLAPADAPSAPNAGLRKPADGLLAVDAAEFSQRFSREPFLIRHSLCDHPLFALERLLKLAQTLPEECIEYNAGKLPVSIEHDRTPRNGLSPDETIRRIAECKSWLVLKYVERDPAYRELLDACLAEVRPHSDRIAPGMCHAQAFVFITSPGSVTPLHIDPEHNFLLQLRGSKTVHMYNGRNRDLVSEQQLEHFYCDRGRNMEHQPWFEDHSWTFDLPAGQGLHFPVTFPHWVQNGDDVSISFSITFRTPDLDRRRALYEMNSRLRAWKLNPPPIGARPWRDEMLFTAFRSARRLGLLKRR
ncbi:MAG: cupin-like domain-containing protein [Planctomyces sp.]|nr:cupin-like domain-containing protein [Planctomyces sp.]